MPKRFIDGEGLWGSDKLSKVDPPEFRPEYAWMLSLALANGVFEYSPRYIFVHCYAFNRPEITQSKVEAILKEFERVGLLFRFMAVGGKEWAFWTGIRKAGRLPPPSDRQYAVGPEPPEEALQAYMSEHGCNLDIPRRAKPKPAPKVNGAEIMRQAEQAENAVGRL